MKNRHRSIARNSDRTILEFRIARRKRHRARRKKKNEPRMNMEISGRSRASARLPSGWEHDFDRTRFQPRAAIALRRESKMLRSALLIAATATLFVAATAASPAAAHWAAAPAAATHAGQATLSDVTDVRWRRHHRHHWRWGAPYGYGYHFYRPYRPHRCGYVWSPRHYRYVWRCW